MTKNNRHQQGFALLEVLVAIGLLGVVLLYTGLSMKKTITHQANQSIANEVADIYTGMFDMVFRPVLTVKNSTGQPATQINESLKDIQTANAIFAPDNKYRYQYRDISAANLFYKFFNGGVDVCNPASPQLSQGPFLACNSIRQPLTISGLAVKGGRIDVLPVPYFGFSDDPSLSLDDINNIRPARAVLYLAGLNSNQGFGEFRDQLAAIKNTLITSNRIEQNDTSAHVETYLAKFGGAAGQFEYATGAANPVPLDEVVSNKLSTPALYNFDSGEWGAAIVVDFSRASVLRADGSVAIEDKQQLCWSFTTATSAAPSSAPGTACAKVINQATPTPEGATLYIDSGLAYKTKDMQDNTKALDRTPVESVLGWFDGARPAKIYMPTCPAGFNAKLAVATSSFSNSNVGDFSNEAVQSNSDQNNPAKTFYGLIYSWEALPTQNPTYWNVSASVGDMGSAQSGIANPASVSFIAFRWCERS